VFFLLKKLRLMPNSLLKDRLDSFVPNYYMVLLIFAMNPDNRV
jgi:hypothetical protein